MGGFPFDLDAQLGAGSDGVRYVATDRDDGAAVHVTRLAPAHTDAARWAAVCQRVAIVSYIRHPAVMAARVWHPDAPDPYLITPRLHQTLADRLGKLSRDACVSILLDLASALSEAHALGIAHGALDPSTVSLTADATPMIDLFGLDIAADATTAFGPCHRARDNGDPPQAADVFALAMTGVTMLTARDAPSRAAVALPDHADTQVPDAGVHLSALLNEMLSEDPDDRPTMHEVVRRLGRADVSKLFTAVSPGVTPPPSAANEPSLSPGDRLGRYDLSDMLGEGGMGKVFRARDISSGDYVALKILHARWSTDEDALRRFYREARLLSQLQNPYIANFIEVNEVDGVHYLAMEFVDGKSLHEVLEDETSLAVDLALTITRQVALALADVHDLGIIHRDVKPANILLVGQGSDRAAKLCDFGIARETATDNELTREGLTIGTPHYMSPEQCVGEAVSAASDIYSLGITLFKMLVGYVPFNASDAQAIVYKHLAEPVPDVRSLVPNVGDRAAAVLGRMLEKQPEARVANARALLEELEPIRPGDKGSVALHPRAPEDGGEVVTYRFEWPLTSAPAELWPHVSHTERLNRAIGLGAVEYTRHIDERGFLTTRGTVKLSGVTLEWQEHPYEWVAPTKLGILREFSAGPFVWLRSAVQLIPDGGATRLCHEIMVRPRGIFGKAAAAMEIGFKARKNLEAVYRRIDETVARHLRRGPSSAARSVTFTDPFEPPPRLARSADARIDDIEHRLADVVDATVAEKLCEYVRHGPAQEVARIRPRALAARHKLDYRAVLRACLHASRLGLLVMLWDVICPRCRIPSNIVESLQVLRDHEHCDACNFDFVLDFARSVEIIFRVDPSLRDVELGTFCIGGPGHTPHVMLQIRLAPRERFEADLMLDEGHYRVAGRQLPHSWGFTVRRGAELRDWELTLRDAIIRHPHASASNGATTTDDTPHSAPTLVMEPTHPHTHRVIDAGRQRIVLCNETDYEIVARIEREGERANAISAAEAAASTAFRELFPGELLSPGNLVSIGRITFLLAQADLWEAGSEGEAFALLNQAAQIVTQAADTAGGAVVKLHGDGVMAAFSNPADAVTASLALLNAIVPLRIAIHTGAAMATSINDRLDYFGRVIYQTEQLLSVVTTHQTIVSEATYLDPLVRQQLHAIHGPLAVATAHEVVGQVISRANLAARPPSDARADAQVASA